MVWQPIFEADTEDGTHTMWATEINHVEQGKFVWIENWGKKGFAVTTSHSKGEPLVFCKSLRSAKRWVTINIR